jgi:aminoglycoside 6'-N-acetyltransferase
MFEKLGKEHFPLLLKWLEAPHVKKWWDRDIKWTPELIEKKYSDYVKGFKRLKLETQVIEKPIDAFIINDNKVDIGYIQYYDKQDFPPEQGYDTSWIPEGCAAIDWYIGELDYIGQGIGSKVLNMFLSELVFKVFPGAFVDPNVANIAAIRVYENVGFRVVKKDKGLTMMIKLDTW